MRRTAWFATIGILALLGGACASGKDTGFPPVLYLIFLTASGHPKVARKNSGVWEFS